MGWEVEYTDESFAWWETLDELAQYAIAFAVDALEELGPAQGRPLVETIKASRHANMKELRPRGGNMRVLFAFDPRRMAILLIGGDKTGAWNSWYERMIPIADSFFDEHLVELRREGEIP